MKNSWLLIYAAGFGLVLSSMATDIRFDPGGGEYLYSFWDDPVSDPNALIDNIELINDGWRYLYAQNYDPISGRGTGLIQYTFSAAPGEVFETAIIKASIRIEGPGSTITGESTTDRDSGATEFVRIEKNADDDVVWKYEDIPLQVKGAKSFSVTFHLTGVGGGNAGLFFTYGRLASDAVDKPFMVKTTTIKELKAPSKN